MTKSKGELTEGVVDLLNEVQTSFNTALERGNYEATHVFRMSRDELIDLYRDIEGEYPTQDFETKYWR